MSATIYQGRIDTDRNATRLKKRDTKVFHIGNNTFQEDVFVPGLQQPQGDFEPYPRLRDPIRNVKHSRSALVTLQVHPKV